ncbi:MAG: TerB family tellurite resistance protein [Candidatus Pelagadaptatus aseana]|uniref:tellurite resistance TerB family protein n=1 Tax=Candidatus Pelagadaptatus aseana TaxID=3120508 RepID=UPI0039B2C9B3
MLNHFKSLLDNCFPEEPAGDNDNLSHRAAAALMVEIATIDEHFDDRELNTLAVELQRQFELPQEGIERLIERAREHSENSTSLYDFTRHINDSFTVPEKFELLVGMWRIAYADGSLDKYEEYMIRKVSELIHLAHGDFIRAKQQARG